MSRVRSRLPPTAVRPGRAGAIVVGCAWSVLACTGPNPRFCDQASDCARGACDVELGTCVEVDGGVPMCELACDEPDEPVCDIELNACRGCGDGEVGDAECATIDDTTPHCAASGACVACTTNDHCPAEQPVCVEAGVAPACQICSGGPDGEAACGARTDGLDHCADDGACVACRDEVDCNEAGDDTIGMTCDAASHTCRACAGDGECASAVCEEEAGRCVAVNEVLYVRDNDGDDDDPCSQAEPCRTIGEALSRLSPDNPIRTIRIARGVYDEALNLGAGFAVDRVYLSGELVDQDDRAELVPPNGVGAIVIADGKQVTITGLHIRDVAAPGGVGDGVRCVAAADASSVALRDVMITGVTASGVDATNCDVTIRRAWIAVNRQGGVSITDGSYDIVNSFIVDNGSSAGAGSQVGGVLLTAVLDGRFAFNTIAGNVRSSDSPFAGGVHCVGGAPLLSSSIIRDGGGGGDAIGGTCTAAFSNSEDAAPGGGNSSADPRLTSDYHLADDSPCIDAADPTDLEPQDFDRDARPIGIQPDMGADEHS